MRALVALLALACTVACGDRMDARARHGRVRVVSLHDVTTELVVALGATDRLVGIEEPVEAPATVRASVSSVRRVSSLESVLEAKPDVVLGMHSLTYEDPDLLRSLKRAGVEVYLAEPSTLEDVIAVTDHVATRIGARSEGDALVARLRADAGGGSSPPVHATRVFVYDCCDPPLTAGGTAVLTDLIRRAGGANIFADVATEWPHVSWEQVVAREPELVVIHDYEYDGQGEVADKVQALRRIPSLEHVPVVAMPLGCSLGGLRSFEGLARLRAALREKS